MEEKRIMKHLLERQFVTNMYSVAGIVIYEHILNGKILHHMYIYWVKIYDNACTCNE